MELSRKGDFDGYATASALAMWGKIPNQEELRIIVYHLSLKRLKGNKSMNRKLSPKRFDRIKSDFERSKRNLCDMFLYAVETYDKEAVIRIANAVWNAKQMQHEADPDRKMLLVLKSSCEAGGEKLTISQIAAFVKAESIFKGARLETPADGWSALRRKCKELGVPILESRKRSQK